MVEDGKPLRYGFKLLALVFVLGVVLQQALFPQGAGRAAPVLAGLAGFIAVLLAGLFQKWRAYFGSVLFAVPGMVFLVGFSVIGTLVLQNEPPEMLREKYGRLTGPIDALFFDDVFHSLSFSLILGLTAGGMTLAAVRKRPYTLRTMGSQLAHLGLILVLAGACIGQVWGVKGRLDLHVGQQADAAVLEQSDGSRARWPLGFSVRLDDFKVEYYRPDYQLVVFRKKDADQERLLKVKAGSDGPQLRQLGLRVEAYFTDHVVGTEIEPVEASAPPEGTVAGALIELSSGEKVWLLEGRGEEKVAGLFFFESAQQAQKQLKQAGQNAGPHFVEIDGRAVAVREGERLQMGEGKTALVARAYLDFVFDPQTRRPAERSTEPNNPALELELFDETGSQIGRRFLFARHPDFHGAEAGGGPRLKYSYLPGPATPRAVLAGQGPELWLAGQQLEKKPLKIGEEFSWPGGRARLARMARVREKKVEYSRSQEENNPLLRLRRVADDRVLELTPGRPARLEEDRFALLAPRDGESVRDYFSLVTILQDGRPVKSEQIEVNSPLYYRGYFFYQTNYRPDDPDYSGLQVVRDPGLWVVYLGFAVNFLGVLCVLWLARLKKKAAGAGESHE